jgi:hypothetical protein
MKLTFFFFAVLGSIPSLAQPVMVPRLRPFLPSPVFVAGSSALDLSGTNVANTTGTATSFTLLDLSAVLTNLQSTLEQALPMVTSVNNNLDFVSSAQSGLFAPAAAAPMGNFSSNLAANSAVNLGVNAAVPTGRSLFNTAVSSAALTTNTPVNSGPLMSNTGLAPDARFS